MAILKDWGFLIAGIGVIVVNAALVYLAWWALFADQSNGRRRCPRCWYDLAYSPGMTCAECGFTARREEQFHHTRRRYRVAIGAILASVLIVLAISGNFSRQNLIAMTPTRVLLWLLPLAESPQSSIYTAINNRAAMAQLSDSQWTVLLERCASGDWHAHPDDDAWIAKYGELVTAYRRQFANRPAQEEVLRKIPPRIDVISPQTWPAGVPVSVGVQVRDWWPWGTQCRMKIEPHIAGVKPITVVRSADDRFVRTPFVFELPPQDAGAMQVEIDLRIERRRLPLSRFGEIDMESDDAKPGEWELAQTQRITVRTKIENDALAQMQPASDDAMAKAIAQALGGGIVKWNQGDSPVRFNIFAPATFTAAFDDTAIGVRLELRHGDELARRLNMWWIAGSKTPGPNPAPAQTSPFGGSGNDRGYGFEIEFEKRDLLQQLNTRDTQWTLRVLSDPLLALRAGPAKKFWQGEIALPVRLQGRPGDAPPRPWETQE